MYKYKEQLPMAWLVYYYRGEIKVKHGTVGLNFYPDNSYSWQTGIPTEYMKINRAGKILVENEDDLPKAKEMLKTYYLNKEASVKQEYERRLKNLAILKGGDADS